MILWRVRERPCPPGGRARCAGWKRWRGHNSKAVAVPLKIEEFVKCMRTFRFRADVSVACSARRRRMSGRSALEALRIVMGERIGLWVERIAQAAGRWKTARQRPEYMRSSLRFRGQALLVFCMPGMPLGTLLPPLRGPRLPVSHRAPLGQSSQRAVKAQRVPLADARIPRSRQSFPACGWLLRRWNGYIVESD